MSKIYENFNKLADKLCANKKVIWTIIIIVLLLQLLVPISMIMGRELIVISGSEINLQVEPIDPYDPFMGRYVSINIVNNELQFKDLNEEVKNLLLNEMTHSRYSQLDVYVTFKNGVNNLSIVDNIYVNKPTDTNAFLKAKLTYSFYQKEGDSTPNIYITFPIYRMYMNEKYSQTTENVIRNLPEEQIAYIKVKILNGEYVVTDMFINDKNIYEYIDESREEEF